MKRNSLTTAVVAGIAGVAGFAGLANAVDLNPDGLGQVLIYPYYTVNKGQSTAFSVVNTDSVNGKAVKVRFLEGYNSREVLDFNLFLSPNDVWTAVITQTGDDSSGAQVSTADHSCTTPSVASLGPVPFSTAAFNGGAGSPFPADGGPTDVTRTREGYFELISMGDIVPGTPLFDTTLHDQTGTPDAGTPACGSPIALGNPGTPGWLAPPTGGLFGAGQVVNIDEGTLYTYNAEAIDGFTATTLFSTSGLLNPSLLQANTNNSSFPGGAVAYIFGAGGQLITLDYADGIDAVSAVFTADTLYNEFFTDANLGAATDWVVTFPTKRFYVDPFYVGTSAIQPFVEVFGENIDGQSNVEVAPQLYDREEGTTTSGDIFSPPTSHPSALPYEVNVISFLSGSDPDAGSKSGVFGSTLVSNIPPYGSDGWLRLGFATGDAGSHTLRADAIGQVVTGLPATGFMGYNVINANVTAGVLANYGGLFRHRSSRTCASTGGVGCS
jgi:hypothetical protein